MNDIYIQFSEKIVNSFSKIPEVSAIFQFGSLSSPGISDIDLIVVLDDNFRKGEKIRKLFWKLVSEKEAYKNIVLHEPYYVSKNLFEELLEHIYINEFDLQLLYPEEYEFIFPKMSKEEKLLINSEFIYNRIIQFAISLATKQFDLRFLLVRGHSIKHSISLYQSDSKELLNLKSLDTIEDYRKKISSGNKINIANEELTELMISSLNDFYALHYLSIKKLLANNFFYIKADKEFSFNYAQNVYIDFSENHCLKVKDGNLVIPMSNLLLSLIAIYGEYNSEVKKRFPIKYSYEIYNENFTKILNRRIDFIEKYWEWNQQVFNTKVGSLGFTMFLGPGDLQ